MSQAIMSDLYDQSRILLHLYFPSLMGGGIPLYLLVENEDLKFMHKAGNLVPALSRLKRTGYVKDDDQNLGLTGTGLIAIESLFRNFLKYIKKKGNPDELDSWIKTLQLQKNSNLQLIRDSYHYIENEPLVKKAFDNYLNDLGSLENLRIFEVELSEQDLGESVNHVFRHIGELNRLFKHRLGRTLFCISPDIYPIMSEATKGRNVNYTNFVASVALVLDAICHKEIESLVEPGKKFPGSISKIETILKHNNIDYNPNTISTLRTIRQLRNTTLLMHDPGSQVVDDLEKMGLTFPIENPREAILTILKSLDSCLREMKTWFT